ncbi:hypothetical protein MLD38_019643 [Melastoma candidum]|uniref:Uncharacterized protein n=1 Tax=Melastoma candidum TaxID=119954 RepID=A0ACB9QYX5_9MYRT|nr:hypothetical protein MLD38_019643 [Melastoma candidum]
MPLLLLLLLLDSSDCLVEIIREFRNKSLNDFLESVDNGLNGGQSVCRYSGDDGLKGGEDWSGGLPGNKAEGFSNAREPSSYKCFGSNSVRFHLYPKA